MYFTLSSQSGCSEKNKHNVPGTFFDIFIEVKYFRHAPWTNRKNATYVNNHNPLIQFSIIETWELSTSKMNKLFNLFSPHQHCI